MIIGDYFLIPTQKLNISYQMIDFFTFSGHFCAIIVSVI